MFSRMRAHVILFSPSEVIIIIVILMKEIQAQTRDELNLNWVNLKIYFNLKKNPIVFLESLRQSLWLSDLRLAASRIDGRAQVTQPH